MQHYLLAIDQGTTNSRAIIFDAAGHPISQHDILLTQSYPRDGWVEQDPMEMVDNTILCCRQALKKAALTAAQIAGIGISNQRETTIIWDRATGAPIYPAIVWQDRRTSDICKHIATLPISAQLTAKTGLLLDPYFSATKICWLLDNIPHARMRAEKGELLFGTVDTYLIWHLTGGKSHVTDATNASRTLLFNIHTQSWDKDILKALNIPESILPTVLDSAAHFGTVDAETFGAPVNISGVAGDQQAATIGQACFKPGMIKATYGTGCFMLLNTGNQVITSQHQLIATIAYRINGQVTYGLEGSIFSAGTTVKWLRDMLGFIHQAADTERMASSVASTEGVYLVPAFTGLGAPYWDPEARGAILGLTGSSSREHIVRAALESVAYQTSDLLHAMMADSHMPLNVLRIDGGMAANNWLLQFLSDILNVDVERPTCIETSALGAAYLAGLQAGIYSSLDAIYSLWHLERCFEPKMLPPQREALYGAWKHAVERVCHARCVVA